MSQHKDEALKAIEHVRQALAEQIKQGAGLETRLLLSTLEYAAEQVESIQKVKPARKATVGHPTRLLYHRASSSGARNPCRVGGNPLRLLRVWKVA